MNSVSHIPTISFLLPTPVIHTTKGNRQWRPPIHQIIRSIGRVSIPWVHPSLCFGSVLRRPRTSKLTWCLICNAVLFPEDSIPGSFSLSYGSYNSFPLPQCFPNLVHYQAPMDSVKPVVTQKIQVKNQWIMTWNKKAWMWKRDHIGRRWGQQGWESAKIG